MSKRNVLEKYRRLMEIADKYADEIKKLAQVQIDITKRVVTELKLQNQWQYRGYFYHDWLRMSPYNDGDVQMWSGGRRGGDDEEEGYFTVSRHIIAGDPAAFEQELRLELAGLAQKNADDKRRALQIERKRLEQQLAALPNDEEVVPFAGP